MNEIIFRAKRNIMRDIKLSLTDEVTAIKEVDRTTNQCDRVFGLCSDFVCEFVCVCVKLWLETISVLRMGTSVCGRVGRSVGQSVGDGENDKNSL